MRTKLKKSLLERVALEQHEHVRLKPTNALEASAYIALGNMCDG